MSVFNKNKAFVTPLYYFPVIGTERINGVMLLLIYKGGVSNMLETKRSITITGEIKVKDSERTVVYLNATIAEDGDGDNINQNIQDAKLYEANKEVVRQEIAEFTEQFYAAQDARATPEQQ